jgi:hypothetical protein
MFHLPVIQIHKLGPDIIYLVWVVGMKDGVPPLLSLHPRLLQQIQEKEHVKRLAFPSLEIIQIGHLQSEIIEFRSPSL